MEETSNVLRRRKAYFIFFHLFSYGLCGIHYIDAGYLGFKAYFTAPRKGTVWVSLSFPELQYAGNDQLFTVVSQEQTVTQSTIQGTGRSRYMVTASLGTRIGFLYLSPQHQTI